MVLLAVGVLHYWAAPTFDHAFQCNGIGPPAKPGVLFKVLREGTYPASVTLSVTFDEGGLTVSCWPPSGGRGISASPSCWGPPTAGPPSIPHPAVPPECMAYWDGTFLWLASNSSHWRRFLPFPPAAWGEKTHFMDEPEENIYYHVL